jgi:hypothetical protein
MGALPGVRGKSGVQRVEWSVGSENIFYGE